MALDYPPCVPAVHTSIIHFSACEITRTGGAEEQRRSPPFHPSSQRPQSLPSPRSYRLDEDALVCSNSEHTRGGRAPCSPQDDVRRRRRRAVEVSDKSAFTHPQTVHIIVIFIPCLEGGKACFSGKGSTPARHLQYRAWSPSIRRLPIPPVHASPPRYPALRTTQQLYHTLAHRQQDLRQCAYTRLRFSARDKCGTRSEEVAYGQQR